MDRREFVKRTCVACIGGGMIQTLSQCRATHYVTGTLDTSGIMLSKAEFMYERRGERVGRKYIIVQHDQLQFPIYIYRFSDNEYSALWMECTHQGTELQASGDHLHCSGHGSEFTNLGYVSQGPAEDNLRWFPVKVEQEQIWIDLRKA